MIWPDDTIVRSGLQQVTPGHPANKYAGLAAMVKCQVSEDAHSNQPCWLTVASDCGDGLSMMLLCQLRRADASPENEARAERRVMHIQASVWLAVS